MTTPEPDSLGKRTESLGPLALWAAGVVGEAGHGHGSENGVFGSVINRHIVSDGWSTPLLTHELLAPATRDHNGERW